MLYYSGNDEDDSVHSKFHKIFIEKFKNEYKKKQHLLSKFIIDESDKYLILCIGYEQFVELKQKHSDNILNVCDLMDRDLGYFTSTKDNILCLDKGQFLYCFVEETRHQIVGCVVCEARDFAYAIKVDSDSSDFVERSEEKVKCHFGVVKIWVHSLFRRKGVASLLMDCIRRNFIYGSWIVKMHIAFCQPTRCGKQFAEKYCGTKHILIY